jgi:uncharacterized membrane protein (Fun14 family)
MTDATPAPRPTGRQKLAEHARHVAPFQWKLLAIFLAIGLVGAGIYLYAAVTHHAATPAASVQRPDGSSGFLGSDSQAPAEPVATSPTDNWTGWFGAKTSTLGFGFAGGFIIGFIFRAFLKRMTLITILIAGGLFALSYFFHVNIDFTHARDVWDSNAQWLTEQATRLKDVAVAHLPSSTGGAAGVFFGLRRR